MRNRVAMAAALAVLLTVGLAGCSAPAPGSFTRDQARADTAAWTKQAVGTVSSPPPASQTKVDDFQTCRTDSGYFTTSFQWRTVTNIAVPRARQRAAARAIESSFESSNWTATESGGLLTLAGPDGEKQKGVITVQTAGVSELSIAVVSPCYQ